MIYLDSCLVIYILEEPDDRGAEVRASMARLSDEQFATSWLVYTECLVGPIKRGDLVARRSYEHFLDLMVPVALGREVFLRAAELRAEFGLRAPEAIHVAAATASGCRALWTNDTRLARAAGSLALVVLEPRSADW